MKHLLLYTCFLLFVCAHSYAQTLPRFSSGNVTIAIPSFMPGIIPDSVNAVAANDTLFYAMHGQVFKKGVKVAPGSAVTLATPWQTIAAMAGAYSKKNKQQIINLYETGSKSKIQALLQGSNGANFLSIVSVAANANLRILAGFEYRNGWLVFTKDDLYGLHENYIVKQNGQYKLSALDDTSSISWNLGLFYKYEPRPLVQFTDIVMRDSLLNTDSVTITLTAPIPRSWVAIFYDKPGGSVTSLVQDDALNDLDKRPQKMTIRVPGSAFIEKGSYTLYFVCLNYPVQRFSKNFKGQKTRQLVVY